MFALTSSNFTSSNEKEEKKNHRQINKRCKIAVLAALTIVVFAAVIGVVIFLTREDEKPKSSDVYAPSFEIEFKLNKTWDADYAIMTSTKYRQLQTQLITEIDRLFKNAINNAGEKYNCTIVTSFRKGSTICLLKTYWNENFHLDKDTDGITRTEINEVLIQHTLIEGFKEAVKSPSLYSVLSTAVPRSLQITKIKNDATTSTTATFASTSAPTTSAISSQTMTTTTLPATNVTTATTLKTIASSLMSSSPSVSPLGPAHICQNETIIIQQAIPCLYGDLDTVNNATTQQEFCIALNNIADCIILGIKTATSVQCTETDKNNAVKKNKVSLQSVLTTFGTPFFIDPCVPP